MLRRYQPESSASPPAQEEEAGALNARHEKKVVGVMGWSRLLKDRERKRRDREKSTKAMGVGSFAFGDVALYPFVATIH